MTLRSYTLQQRGFDCSHRAIRKRLGTDYMGKRIGDLMENQDQQLTGSYKQCSFSCQITELLNIDGYFWLFSLDNYTLSDEQLVTNMTNIKSDVPKVHTTIHGSF